MSSRTKAILVANCAAVMALFYTVGVIPPTAGRTADRMLLIAHRGDVAHHPENTIQAFLAAAEQGADGIEMDVWRSASGSWWVMHDPTVDRTTNGTGRIATLTDPDLASLVIDGGLGYGINANRSRVPTLRQALDALRAYPGLVYVHSKDPDLGAAGDLARILTRSGRSASVTVIVGAEASARAIDRVDERLRVIVLRDGLGVPEPGAGVDGWLTSAHRILRADIVSSRPYDVEVYAAADDGSWDEAASIRRANLFNVRAYITNDLEEARRTLAAGS